jgi:hypothetical protein
MKNITMPLVLLVALVGLCAVLYHAWHVYEQKASESQTHGIVAAPPSSGIPDILHKDAPPPPQP